MRWLLSGAVATLAASCITIQTPTPAPGTNGASSPPAGAPVTPRVEGGQRAVEELVALVNAHRRSVRCPELVWMQPVASAAQAHSDDMARRSYFDHRSPEGAGPADRLAAQRVSYRALAENIAHHPGTPRDVLNGWLSSPGHRQNLEQCMYTHHGVGLREGYWTHLFVTPLSPPAGS